MKKILVACLLITAVLFIGCKDDKLIFNGSFLEVLGQATKLVQAECPGAILYEGDAVVKDSAMKAEDFIGWTFIYYVPGNTTAVIQYKDSQFSNVSIIPYPTYEDCLIKEVKMSLVEAIDLMRKANYSDIIAAGNLRWPLYPGSELSYIFGCPNIGHIFVGVESKKVTVQPFTAK